MKIAIFKNKDELRSISSLQNQIIQRNIIYKFERCTISVESFNIREDISTG